MLPIDRAILSCPICSSRHVSEGIELYDDRYGHPGFFKLTTCTHCGHKALGVDFNSDALGRLYTEYYPRKSFDENKFTPHGEVSEFKAWFDGAYRSAFRWVPENVRVLDIGCGFGETLAYHAARGCDVYGVEADGNIQRVADKFGYRVHIGLFDPALYEPDFFDYVTMDQVIEHVTDPLTTMRGIARVLKPEGKAVLSTPNANGWGARVFRKRWINWHAPYHLQFFSVKSIKVAAEQAGLSLERIQTITSSEWLHYQWIHLILFPKIGKPSVFWSPTSRPRFHEKVLLKTLSVIHQTKINHLITRFFDSAGLGDNYLFFLKKT